LLRTLRGSVGNVCCDHLIAEWSILEERGSCRAVVGRGTRVLVFAKDIHQLNALVIVWADFVDRYPSVVTGLDDVFASEGIWANVHHEEVAQA